ncbi:MAG: serine/threonine protein phosphatase [Deltaproteobacteria bacterium]|nr:serine/threonine protein phosphatase [Deltaproteobacteria bacterium]
MLRFSDDPQVAEKQMHAVIFYLVTFGYIDGDFDRKEKDFIRDHVRRLVNHRVETGAANLAPPARAALSETYTTRFLAVFDATDKQIEDMFTEAVTREEDIAQVVQTKLKVRCFEIFQDFDRNNQEQLMDAIDELVMADGEAHPAEIKFRSELAQLLEADLSVELVEEGLGDRPVVEAPAAMPSHAELHPFFDQFEHDYAADRDTMNLQIAADRAAIARTLVVLDDWRRRGQGKLAGKRKVGEIAVQDAFLDGHIWACPARPGRRYELTVLGDLHGCYSCLKGAVMQARFFEKVRRFREDPAQHPEPKLVLLGDYIDRGIFSLNGVLRTALLLFCTAPEHVVILRGNHEYFVEFEGDVYGGVKPSEAIDSLKQRVSTDVFRDYMRLFEALPSVFIFDRTFFVHGGIPRDRTFKKHFADLASLNHPDLRFEMMWSDPSSADVVPVTLQAESARFAFGRLQAQRFLQRIGCHALVRGHQKIDEGLRLTYDDPNMLLLTLFSAGGDENHDLPARSNYRRVTPMALTLRHEDGRSRITPWEIDWAPYNDPQRNAFFREPCAPVGSRG